MAAPRAAHQATVLPSGAVLITGGCSGDHCGRVLASVELYDPASRTFRAASPMSIPRASHAATLLPDGRVLVCGGWNGERAVSSAETYDPATGAWTPVGDMAEARASLIAVPLLDGRVLIVGGGDGRPGNSGHRRGLRSPHLRVFDGNPHARQPLPGHPARRRPGARDRRPGPRRRDTSFRGDLRSGYRHFSRDRRHGDGPREAGGRPPSRRKGSRARGVGRARIPRPNGGHRDLRPRNRRVLARPGSATGPSQAEGRAGRPPWRRGAGGRGGGGSRNLRSRTVGASFRYGESWGGR